MDDLDLINDISTRLIQINDEWDRYTCKSASDFGFVPIMHDETIETAKYLSDNKKIFFKTIQTIFLQYGSERLTVILDNLLYGLNRNNELYPEKKNEFQTYIDYFDKKAAETRKSMVKWTPQAELRLSREGDWYKALNDVCNIYIDELKVFLPDETQNKLQPEPEIEAIHPTRTLKKEQLDQLYSGLVKGGFIPDGTDKKHFDYVFGGGNKPKNFKHLEWKPAKQLLRELLELLINPDIKPAVMERLVPLYFSYKSKPMKLAKAKTVPCTKSDNIKNFIKKLATL